MNQSDNNAPAAESQGVLHDRSIGRIIAAANKLTADQVEQILAHQKKLGVRFGEAAVALGLANGEDVLWALSQQFHYPYAPGSATQLSAEVVLAGKPFSVQAEAFRVLRSQINMRLFAAGQQKRAIAVISPEKGDGKSYFAANMAVAMSQLGGRTLLVDADMRNPRQHEIFGLEESRAGLSGILSGRSESNVIRTIPDLPSLFLMPVGTVPPNPTELLERPAFGLLMRELLSKFDYVIVDTPAAEFGADSIIAAAHCGAALVVTRKDATRFAAVQDLVASLSNGPAELAGVVLNEH
ncbi:MAG: polysaccharide biosynthesis tyrosine autokinase [Burkholderiales bacterium]|nr:polysaccharide biosynthesis tyrosine autokinase [Burkholderiales bacterium]